jgi:hypothetical protein
MFLAGIPAAMIFLFGVSAQRFVPAIALKAALFLVFWLWTALAGKKNRPVFTLIVMAGIIICNLFPAYGKILFQAGPFTIAAGSLAAGCGKALNLEGLIMLSRAVISPELKLPGALGKLLGETFRILEKFNTTKIFAGTKTGKKRLMERLDEMLLELSVRE